MNTCKSKRTVRRTMSETDKDEIQSTFCFTILCRSLWGSGLDSSFLPRKKCRSVENPLDLCSPEFFFFTQKSCANLGWILLWTPAWISEISPWKHSLTDLLLLSQSPQSSHRRTTLNETKWMFSYQLGAARESFRAWINWISWPGSVQLKSVQLLQNPCNLGTLC